MNNFRRVMTPVMTAISHVAAGVATLPLVIFAVSWLGTTDLCSGSEAVCLRDFLVEYLKTDKVLEASRLRLAAAEGATKVKGYAAYPSVRVDLTTPNRSWRRSYSYQQYLGTLYRGYLETKDASYGVSLGLSQKLPSGGNLSVTGYGYHSESDFSYEGFPPTIPISRETGDRQFLMDVGLSLDQPLFGPWQKKDDVRKASLRLQTAQAQYRLDSAHSLSDATNAFFDYLIGSITVGIEALRLERAQSEAEAAAGQFEGGLISEIELLDKRIAESSRRVFYNQARSTQASVLKKLRVITPSAPSDLEAEDLTTLAPLDASRVYPPATPVMAKARCDVEIARIGLSETERRRYGQTTLSFWYGLQGLGDDFAESRDLFGWNRWGGSLKLGFTFPEPGLAADIDAARASLRAAEAVYEEALEAAVEEREVILETIHSERATFVLLTRQSELLEELVAVRREQLEQEVISLRDLVDLEIKLLETRISVLETLRRLNLAWVDLALSSGENPIELLGAVE